MKQNTDTLHKLPYKDAPADAMWIEDCPWAFGLADATLVHMWVLVESIQVIHDQQPTTPTARIPTLSWRTGSSATPSAVVRVGGNTTMQPADVHGAGHDVCLADCS